MVHGAGAPLVLPHGGFGAAGMFDKLLPTLAARHHVFAVDPQGHGCMADSDRPPRIEQLADDIVTFLAHLGLARARVIG